MTDILTSFSTRKTHQTEQADVRQEKNNAGGYAFEVTDLDLVRRFLTLGTSSGTYYVGAQELTHQAASAVVKMAETDHATLVDAIVDISSRGAAPKNDYAIFALAIAASHGDTDQRTNALNVLPQVARTGTHLFQFATYIEQFRGWGRGLRRAVANWYTGKTADALAYQVIKYRQRHGWTHRDLLRVSHPETADPALRGLFSWITKGDFTGDTPQLVEGFIKAQEPGANIPALIDRYGLSWEMLPDEAMNKTPTWDALLDRGVPQTALIRQLPRLTRLGMLPAMGGRTAEIAARLSDSERLIKARVHPINMLVAQRTYASGASARGSSTWTPNRKIVDALDAGFYAAFGAVESADKNTMLALDVSGSMGFSSIDNMPLTPREASAALALVQMSTEPEVEVMGFSHKLTPLSISPRQRLDDAIRAVSGLPFGSTDCALPIQYALSQGLEVETFVVYTDNETYYGDQHPHQALVEYREKTGIAAKLIVVGMTGTRHTIADPTDAGMLDVAGFDSAVPRLINDFSAGR